MRTLAYAFAVLIICGFSAPQCGTNALTSDPSNGFGCVALPSQKSWIYPTTGSATSGFGTTIPDGITAVAIAQTTLLATGAMTLPVNPTDGQPITINCPKGVTLLSLAASGSQSISNNFLPTTCGVNTPIRVKYYAINATWYPN